MSLLRSRYPLGAVVYRPHNPRRPGKVVATLTKNGVQQVTVKFLNGEILTLRARMFRDFVELIKGHEDTAALYKNVLVRAFAIRS